MTHLHEQMWVKRQMLKRTSAAIADAYRLPDILIFMREYPPDMVS